MAHQYTQEQLKEFVNCFNSPIYFIEKYCKIETPSRGEQEISLNPNQLHLLNVLSLGGGIEVSFERQCGTSTLMSLYHLWEATFCSDKTFGIGGPRQSQAARHIEIMMYAYERLPEWLQVGLKKNNKTQVVFSNGSRVLAMAVTPNAFRGMALSKLFIDQYRYLKKDAKQYLDNVIIPVSSSLKSSVLLLNTVEVK